LLQSSPFSLDPSQWRLPRERSVVASWDLGPDSDSEGDKEEKVEGGKTVDADGKNTQDRKWQTPAGVYDKSSVWV
jgi:hypothetical protein